MTDTPQMGFERACRALCELNGDDWLREGPEGLIEAYAPQVRAVLEAIKEPDEGMIAASNREWDGRMSYRSSGAWQATIDALLSSGEPTEGER